MVYKNKDLYIVIPESFGIIMIQTKNYTVYWDNYTNDLSIFSQDNKNFAPRIGKEIISMNKKVDMSLFIELDGDHIEYASTDLIDQKIERILNLKIFI